MGYTWALRTVSLLISLAAGLPLFDGSASAQPQPEKTFVAVVTDAQGIETAIRNLVFYWEERLSETAFVPHEVKQVPVKHGNGKINVRFETIKQIDVKSGSERAQPEVTITLANGKTGEFALAIPGSFKGESDFGEIEFLPSGLKKIVFK